MIKKVVVKLIRLYQKTLSVDHGFVSYFMDRTFERCRFYPTCSEYTRLAMEKYGIIIGVFYGLKRILRCHPFSKGGYDPIE